MELPRRILSDTLRAEPYRDSQSLVSTASSSTGSVSSTHSFDSMLEMLGTSDTEDEDAGITPKSRTKTGLPNALGRASSEEQDRTPTPSPQRTANASTRVIRSSASLPTPVLSPLRVLKRPTHPATSPRRKGRSPLTPSPPTFPGYLASPLSKHSTSPSIRLTKSQGSPTTYLDFDQTYPLPSQVPLPLSPGFGSPTNSGQGIGLEDGDPFAVVSLPRANAFAPSLSPSPPKREAIYCNSPRQTVVSVVEGGAILSAFPVPPPKTGALLDEFEATYGKRQETLPLPNAVPGVGAMFGGIDQGEDVDVDESERAKPARPSSWRSPLHDATHRKTSSTLRYAMHTGSESGSDSDSETESDSGISRSSTVPPPVMTPLSEHHASGIDPNLLLSMLAATTQQQVELRKGIVEMRRVADEIKACTEVAQRINAAIPEITQETARPGTERDLPAAFIESLPEVYSLLLTLDGLVHHVPLSARSCDQVFNKVNLDAIGARVSGWERVVRGVRR